MSPDLRLDLAGNCLQRRDVTVVRIGRQQRQRGLVRIDLLACIFLIEIRSGQLAKIGELRIPSTTFDLLGAKKSRR